MALYEAHKQEACDGAAACWRVIKQPMMRVLWFKNWPSKSEITWGEFFDAFPSGCKAYVDEGTYDKVRLLPTASPPCCFGHNTHASSPPVHCRSRSCSSQQTAGQGCSRQCIGPWALSLSTAEGRRCLLRTWTGLFLCSTMCCRG